MSVYVADTHPLAWYATGKHQQLLHKVLRAFHAASDTEALIYVPVLWEWEFHSSLHSRLLEGRSFSANQSRM